MWRVSVGEFTPAWFQEVLYSICGWTVTDINRQKFSSLVKILTKRHIWLEIYTRVRNFENKIDQNAVKLLKIQSLEPRLS